MPFEIGRVGGQFHFREPPREMLEYNPPLHPRQGGAEADMNAMAEAQMLVLRPPDVERSRPFENRRVPARGAVEKHDVRTGLDLGAEKIGLLGGAQHDHLHRRVLAKTFLNPSLPQRRVADTAGTATLGEK